MRYLLLILFCLNTTLYAQQPSIDVEMLSGARTIPQILTIQQKMTMSANPKELSAEPQAICFAADIVEFLPASDSNPKQIYGCIFSDQVAMNAALLRAGLFVHTSSGIADDETLYSSKLMSTVGGHDFTGNDLREYYKQPGTAEAKLEKFAQFNSIEDEFHKKVVDPILQNNNEDFIFFAIINTRSKFKQNLSHELLHAQYYDIPQLSTILRSVWQNEVSSQDKEVIINALTNGGYDIQQEELLLREFYSYFMQYDAENYLNSIPVLTPISPLVRKYAPKITKALQSHNISVLKIT